MTAAAIPPPDPIIGHTGLWTEQDYFALPEPKGDRIELIDGMLFVSPIGDYPHQELVAGLCHQLRLVLPKGCFPYAGGNVRVGTDRLLIPDVVVTRRRLTGLTADAADVALVCEVVSPSSREMDRYFKPRFFAGGGIDLYLLVERKPDLQLILHRLNSGGYVEHARASRGQHLDLPGFDCAIDVTALLYED